MGPSGGSTSSLQTSPVCRERGACLPTQNHQAVTSQLMHAGSKGGERDGGPPKESLQRSTRSCSAGVHSPSRSLTGALPSAVMQLNVSVTVVVCETRFYKRRVASKCESSAGFVCSVCRPASTPWASLVRGSITGSSGRARIGRCRSLPPTCSARRVVPTAAPKAPSVLKSGQQQRC